MEHYRCHMAYILKTRVEITSDTVGSLPKQFIMPLMYSTDVTIHAAQDLIYALKNPAPATLLVKLGDGNKESLRSLSEIFGKETPLSSTSNSASQEGHIKRNSNR